MFGQGSSVTTTKNSYGASGAVMLGYITASTATSGVFGSIETTIGGYSSGNTKQIISNSTAPNSSTTSYLISMSSCLYRSPAPVTSLTLLTNSASWNQHTTVTLFGMASKYNGNVPTTPSITSVTDQGGFVAVDFAVSATDAAQIYAVTGSDSVTTYSANTPVITPVTVGTGTTFTAKSINSFGTSSSSASSSITSYNSYSSIATFTVTNSSTNNVVFGNIPQHYSHLQLRFIGRSARAAASDNVYMRMNGDATNSYAWHRLTGDGGSATAASYQPESVLYIGTIPGSSASANTFGSGIVDILDYSSNVKMTTTRSIDGYDNNGSGIVESRSGLWAKQAPVSQLQIANYIAADNFAVGTKFALYGMA